METDNIKIEMFKELGNRTTLKDILVKGIKRKSESDQVPASWKESRIVMILKTRHPKAKDLRLNLIIFFQVRFHLLVK